MQVAHKTENITHAVLSNNENIAFGISDDPAFFQILSQSLYKNPTLAMVRETICNAWDAHIDNECTDIPLSIELKHDKLIIKDFGKGIPQNLISQVYGVYGASTKKNDSRSTGGFGLGCKSPFAYTDHFEVINCNGGIRTIYNMSKSSAEREGRPSITAIVSVPTTETGIQVTINIKPHDYDKLEEYIRSVVFQGDIKANFNTELLKTIGFDQADYNFILVDKTVTTNRLRDGLAHQDIWVRYGNVIYPVESFKEIEPLYKRTATILNDIYGCSVVLLAPPDSISMTPSRESLTASEITTKTLRTLLANFLMHSLDRRSLTEDHQITLNQVIKQKALDDCELNLASKLHFYRWEVPGLVKGLCDVGFIKTKEDFRKLELLARFKSTTMTSDKWLAAMKIYLHALSDNGSINRGLVQTWLRVFVENRKTIADPYKNRHWYSDGYPTKNITTKWWQKRVCLPLVKKLKNALSDFGINDLYFTSGNVCDPHMTKHGVIPTLALRVSLRDMTSALDQLMQPTLVICHNKDLITKRLKEWGMNNHPGSIPNNSYFVLEIPRTKEANNRFDSEISSLKDVTVVDLRGRTKSEEEKYQEQKSARESIKAGTVKKPVTRLTGLVTLDSLLWANKCHIWNEYRIDVSNVKDAAQIKTTKEPVFVVLVSTADSERQIAENANKTIAGIAAKLWGSEGGVTSRRSTRDSYIKKGAITLEAFLRDKLISDIQNSQNIKDHLAFSHEKASNYLNTKTTIDHSKQSQILELYKMLVQIPQLNALFPNYVPLPEVDYLKFQLWLHLAKTYPYNSYPDVKDCCKVIDDAALSPDAISLLDKLIGSPCIEFINVREVRGYFNQNHKDDVKMENFINIIKSIIN